MSVVLGNCRPSILSGTFPKAYSTKAFCRAGSGLCIHRRNTFSIAVWRFSSGSCASSCANARTSSKDFGRPFRLIRGSPLTKGFNCFGTVFLLPFLRELLNLRCRLPIYQAVVNYKFLESVSHASLATAGTCPFPMAPSLSI